MAPFYPVFVVPQTRKERQAGKVIPKYRPSWRFDFEAGDFVVDASGAVVSSEGYHAWVQWMAKTVLTERYAHIVYSQRYGVEINQIARIGSQDRAKAAIVRTITEALLTDPRTKIVKDFVVDWQGDACQVSFTAVPAIGTNERVEITLRG